MWSRRQILVRTIPIAVIAAGIPARAAAAETIHVPESFASIQQAIAVAVEGDEIVVAPGTYHESINFLGKAITLRSSHGPEVTILRPQEPGTVVTCDSAEGLGTVLDGFTITGGSASQPGGGMRNAFASPTIVRCSFRANLGGGLYNESGRPRIVDCTFARNTATQGGGIFNVNSNPVIVDCTFVGNTAIGGGGMYNQSSHPTVIGCTFTANRAEGGFGGGSGGAMLNDSGSSPLVINCAFIGNVAAVAGRGGAMYNVDGSDPSVTNCTFSGNTAAEGGAMYNLQSSPTVTNCIVWANQAQQIFDGDAAAAMVRYSNVQDGWSGLGSDNIDADPLFLDPARGDCRLGAGSASIDAGDNTALVADGYDLDGDGDVSEPIPLDLGGNPRFADDPNTPDSGLGQPPIVDMGAFEFVDPAVCLFAGLNQCEQTDTCSWHVPGCGPAPSFHAGCYTACDDLVDCPPGWTCRVVVYDPCIFSMCLACAAQTSLCLPRPGDIDADGVVDQADLGALLACMGQLAGPPCLMADANMDGAVNALDLIELLLNWG